MPERYLALLKSLALRPTRNIAVNLAPIVSALEAAGYVTLGPEGWSATAVGCMTIEQSRMVANLSIGSNVGPASVHASTAGPHF
jgi:hypothetical protein